MNWSKLNPLRIAVLDDHALIRMGLLVRLQQERDLYVVATYGSSREALAQLAQDRIDVLVLDYALGVNEFDGLGLIRLLRIRQPQLRLLICSVMESPATVSVVLRAGARGFIGKSQGLDDLAQAVRTVARERIYLSPAMQAEMQGLASEVDPAADAALRINPEISLLSNPSLTPRELEVLRCCLEGLSVSQIAAKFVRSRKTISGQKQSALRKLGLSRDLELFRINSQLGELPSHGRE
ncbi:response regulator transcription factor [Pseudomonas sp. HR96]|uniref:response regulator transcription factor n=1 Tax=Pseudomonas sp. HR96 TaxID=1027966 RepID=UPI002A755060|nr:response regulator transcription factor [Pseudomonas sp. HR96]WPO99004.1 response regulator transcription factor [Pseudomonas sp. HR96]